MSTTKRVVLAAVAASIVTVLGVSAPAWAVDTFGQWGTFTADDPSDAPDGTVTFARTDIGAVTYTTETDPSYSGILLVSTEASSDEWVNLETAPGMFMGTSGPTDLTNMLHMSEDSDSNQVGGILHVTFEHAVPADKLAVVIGDLDSENVDDPDYADRVTIDAVDSNDNDLTQDELIGNAAGDEVFNYCDVTVDANMPLDCSDTPDSSAPIMGPGDATHVYFFGDPSTSSDVGATAWIAPSHEVKELSLVWDSYADGGSSIRVWIGVKQDTPNLPDTGAAPALLWGLGIAAVGFVGTGIALVGARRRTTA